MEFKRSPRICLVGAALALLTGCGRHTAPASAGASQPAARQAAAQADAAARRQEIQGVMDQLKAAGPDAAKRLAVLQAWFKRNPEAERHYAPMALQQLLAARQSKQAVAYTQRLLDQTLHSQPHALAQVASLLTGPGARSVPDPALLPLALRCAQRADELLERKNSAAADALAGALFRSGRKADAIAAQQRAIDLAAKSPQRVEQLRKRLAEYKK